MRIAIDSATRFRFSTQQMIELSEIKGKDMGNRAGGLSSEWVS